MDGAVGFAGWFCVLTAQGQMACDRTSIDAQMLGKIGVATSLSATLVQSANGFDLSHFQMIRDDGTP